MMAEYFRPWPVARWFLLVKQSKESVFTNAVFFRTNRLPLSPPCGKSNPRWNVAGKHFHTARRCGGFCVCKIVGRLSCSASDWKWRNCVRQHWLLSLRRAVFLADGRGVKKSDLKKMNTRPPWVCGQGFLASVEISRSPGARRERVWSAAVGGVQERGGGLGSNRRGVKRWV